VSTGKPIREDDELSGHGVILTPLGLGDLELVRAWRNRDEVRIHFGDSGYIGPEQQAAWYDRYRSRPDDVMFLIRLADRRLPVGAIALYNIEPAARRAEYGRIMIGEAAARGRGTAAAASRVLCQWAFGSLHLGSLYLWVMEDNHRALALYRRLGFVDAQAASARPGTRYMELAAETFAAYATAPGRWQGALG
jgi:RimJ/RimL family protein N-acetyltransferase